MHVHIKHLMCCVCSWAMKALECVPVISYEYYFTWFFYLPLLCVYVSVCVCVRGLPALLIKFQVGGLVPWRQSTIYLLPMYLSMLYHNRPDGGDGSLSLFLSLPLSLSLSLVWNYCARLLSFFICCGYSWRWCSRTQILYEFHVW